MAQAWLQSVAVLPSPPTARFSADSLLCQIVLLPVHQSTTLINGYKDKFCLIPKACRWWKRCLQKERGQELVSDLGFFVRAKVGKTSLGSSMVPRVRAVCEAVMCDLSKIISSFSLITVLTSSKRKLSHAAQLPISLLRSLLQQKGASGTDPSTFFATYKCHW